MIMRKNLASAEAINIEIMWYYAFGLAEVPQKLRRNQGIIDPESEACVDIVPPSNCKLSPEAKQEYVKSQAQRGLIMGLQQ